MRDFAAAGVAVFAISYDPVEVLAAFAEKHGITFDLLSDQGSRVIRELGLEDVDILAHQAFYGIEPRPRYAGLPFPGQLLLNADGTVHQKRFYSSYRERETGVAALELGFGLGASTERAKVEARRPGVTVRAALDSTHYRFFQRHWLTIDLEPATGLRIHGPEQAAGHVPLIVEIEPVDGLVVGEPTFSPTIAVRLAHLGEAIPMFEGNARIMIPLTFQRREGDVRLVLRVEYQACADSECMLPDEVGLELLVCAQPHVE
jgi:hypothetical protein